MNNYEEFEIDPFYFLDDIEVDQNLFAQIQKYVQEVQADSNVTEYLCIDFGNSSFFIENAKTSETYNHKPSDNKKTGILLTTVDGNFTQKEWENFINSELFQLFEIGVCGETEEGKMLYLDDYIEEANASSIIELLNNKDYQDCFVPYLNFPFNTTPLCKTIQYLAKHFNCPLDKIKITINDPNEPIHVNSSNSNSNGCFGMLVLMISIGCAGIYGLIELASKLIV